MTMDLMVTLWPSMPHFKDFIRDQRLSGIRLNSAMMSSSELDTELAIIKSVQTSATASWAVPLWFDVKGRQPRIAKVHPFEDHLEVTLNHRIHVETPVPVLFKAGADGALLERIQLEGDATRLIFRGGPQYKVKEGESLHIRHKSFDIWPPLFTNAELEKIQKVRAAGIKKWFLSYVEGMDDVAQFLELVGNDAEVMLKIESQRGLEYVAKYFKKRENLRLVAARGDMYVEIEHPHTIPNSLRLIIEKDKEALAGSRILLSVVRDPVPECCDFMDLAWLYDIGYREVMLCDELCLKGPLLHTAVSAFDAFRKDYQPKTSGFWSWWKK